MDCFFNAWIPKSTESELIFRPIRKTFVTGISSKYSFIYDEQLLADRLTEKQFSHIARILNEELLKNWPSTLSLFCGYLFTPITLGASCICPYSCIYLAKDALIRKIDHYNLTILEAKGLQLAFHESCSTSWITLSITKIRKLGSMISTKSIKDEEYECGSQTDIFSRSFSSK